MKQKRLSNWLKVMIIGVGIVGLAVYAWMLPVLGYDARLRAPEYAAAFWPWLVFLWGTAIPCYIVLVLGWKISTNIARDRSFSKENAAHLKWVSILAAADTGYFLFGNFVFFAFRWNHPGVLLAALLISIIGVAIAAAAAALSHLVLKAATLQEENDLTI